MDRYIGQKHQSVDLSGLQNLALTLDVGNNLRDEVDYRDDAPAVQETSNLNGSKAGWAKISRISFTH